MPCLRVARASDARGGAEIVLSDKALMLNRGSAARVRHSWPMTFEGGRHLIAFVKHTTNVAGPVSRNARSTALARFACMHSQ